MFQTMIDRCRKPITSLIDYWRQFDRIDAEEKNKETAPPHIVSTDTPVNPCMITQVNLDAEMRVHEEICSYSIDEPEPVQYANVKTVLDTYRKATDILTGKLERFIPNLTYCLVPRFGDTTPELEDSKVGGIPDLRNHLYVKGNRRSLELNWPRCGCCHTFMTFVGQFDLYPWLLPMHAAFSRQAERSYRSGVDGVDGVDEYAYFSGIGNYRMIQHACLHDSVLWHLFVCPNASRHWDNPNTDAHVLITRHNKPMLDGTLNPGNVLDADWEKRVLAFAKDYPHIIQTGDTTDTADEDNFVVKPRLITGYDFRLKFDRLSCGEMDEVDELVKANPDVFVHRPGDFAFFGSPQSQQTDKRFFSTFGSHTGDDHVQASRMTPIIHFSDEKADMTYQIYGDPKRSNGHYFYAKTDASCT